MQNVEKSSTNRQHVKLENYHQKKKTHTKIVDEIFSKVKAKATTIIFSQYKTVVKFKQHIVAYLFEIQQQQEQKTVLFNTTQYQYRNDHDDAKGTGVVNDWH